MVTRWPVPRCTRCWITARVMRNGAMRLTASVRANSSGVVSATGLMKNTPALLTTMSGTPGSTRIRATIRSTPAGSARSHRKSVRRSLDAPTAVHQSQEFVARLRVLEQCAAQGARYGLRVLLLDPAHHHAEVGRFDHHADAAGVEHLHERIGHLVGEALLYLQPAREHLDHARDLGKAHEPTVREIRHVRLAEERQQVVLAQRVDLDVAHAHEVFVTLTVERVADHVGDLHVIAAGQPLERGFDAGGSVSEAFAHRILAQLGEHLPHQGVERRSHPGRGHRRRRRGVRVGGAVQAGRFHLVASHACWPSGPGLSSAHVKLKLFALVSTAGASAAGALWTFPSILASAFLVAWGAEAAQFLDRKS